jgi:hypothetical protein
MGQFLSRKGGRGKKGGDRDAARKLKITRKRERDGQLTQDGSIESGSMSGTEF